MTKENYPSLILKRKKLKRIKSRLPKLLILSKVPEKKKRLIHAGPNVFDL